MARRHRRAHRPAHDDVREPDPDAEAPTSSATDDASTASTRRRPTRASAAVTSSVAAPDTPPASSSLQTASQQWTSGVSFASLAASPSLDAPHAPSPSASAGGAKGNSYVDAGGKHPGETLKTSMGIIIAATAAGVALFLVAIVVGCLVRNARRQARTLREAKTARRPTPRNGRRGWQRMADEKSSFSEPYPHEDIFPLSSPPRSRHHSRRPSLPSRPSHIPTNTDRDDHPLSFPSPTFDSRPTTLRSSVSYASSPPTTGLHFPQSSVSSTIRDFGGGRGWCSEGGEGGLAAGAERRFAGRT